MAQCHDGLGGGEYVVLMMVLIDRVGIAATFEPSSQSRGNNQFTVRARGTDFILYTPTSILRSLWWLDIVVNDITT